MSYTDYYSSDPDWKEPKMRTPKLIKVEVSPTSSGKNKYSQKFCEKWLSIFSPWLARCEDDPNKPFCRACQCRLDCNRCHLQRHERTSKHARNLEILVHKGEGAARQNLSIRQERSKYYQQRRKLYPSKGDGTDMDMEAADDEYADESVTEFQFVQTEAAPGDQYNDEPVLKQEQNVPETKHSITPKNQKMLQVRNNNNNFSGARKSQQQQQQQQQQQHNRGHQQEQHQVQQQQQQQQRKGPIQSLMQIQKDKSDLMDSIKEIMGNSFQQSPPREKNHVDLFFESVSSSVKALSPKLIAEAKMRVSQLICELELRGLTESSDVNTSVGNVGSHAVVVATQDGGGNAFIIGQSTSTNNDDNGGITIS